MSAFATAFPSKLWSAQAHCLMLPHNDAGRSSRGSSLLQGERLHGLHRGLPAPAGILLRIGVQALPVWVQGGSAGAEGEGIGVGLMYPHARVMRAFRPASRDSLQPPRSTTAAAEVRNCAGRQAMRQRLPEPQAKSRYVARSLAITA